MPLWIKSNAFLKSVKHRSAVRLSLFTSSSQDLACGSSPLSKAVLVPPQKRINGLPYPCLASCSCKLLQWCMSGWCLGSQLTGLQLWAMRWCLRETTYQAADCAAGQGCKTLNWCRRDHSSSGSLGVGHLNHFFPLWLWFLPGQTKYKSVKAHSLLGSPILPHLHLHLCSARVIWSD